MAERVTSQPLFERQQQSFQQGGDELTQFLNHQRRMRFNAVDRLTHLMPYISRRVLSGDFKQLENLDHIREAEQLITDRYKLYFNAVVANGTVNTHMNALKPNSPPEQMYIQKKEAALVEIEERKFLRPFTDEQKAAYYRIKEVSQQVREGTYQPPAKKEEIIGPIPQEMPEILEDAEKLKPKVVMNLSTYDENETIIVNGREIPITLDGIITLETLSEDIESYVTKGELWKKLRTGPIKEEELIEIISQTSTILAQAGISNFIASEPGKRTTNYYLDTDNFDIILDENAGITEESDQLAQDENASIEAQAKRAPTLLFAEGVRINDIQREDFNMGDIRLLQAVANNASHMSSRILSEVTGIPQRDVKSHITGLARTLSRIVQQPVTVESTTKGFRLAGITFDIQTPPSSEGEKIDEPEQPKVEVDFADRQISAMLGAIEYRIITQNKDSLVESMGQSEYDALAESCRQLSLLVRATNPTTAELAAAARRQNITFDQYKEVRDRLLNSVSGLRSAPNREELLAPLSTDHQNVLGWLLNQPNGEFTQLIENANALEETQLKAEQALYANSWTTETRSDTKEQILQNTEVISPTKMKALQPAILEAIQIAQLKVPQGQSLTPDNLNRLFKPEGQKTGYINKQTIDFAMRNGIIAQEGTITAEDVIVLTFLYEVVSGKTFRRGFKNDITSLKRASNEIRDEIRRQQISQQETTN